MEAMLFAWGIRCPLSNTCTVRSDTLARLASSTCDQPNQPRAARLCSGVTTSGRGKIHIRRIILLVSRKYAC